MRDFRCFGKQIWWRTILNENFTPNIVPNVLKNEYAERSEKEKMNAVRSEKEKEGYNTRTSQGVTHPCTTLAQARLTSEF